MDISIIVCTYNRCQSLKNTLDSLVRQECDGSFDYEIIVVDNNSTDNTKDVINSYVAKFNSRLHYAFEDARGLSYARNRGIKEARGKIVSFTDDDCTHSKNWIEQIVSTFQNYNADAVLGKITLMLPPKVPELFSEEFLKRRLAHVDYGGKILRIDDKDLVGANMSFKADVFIKLGKFNSIFEPCEDTEFTRRISHKNMVKLYCPTAEVFHWIPPTRLTEKYFLKQSYVWGKKDVFFEKGKFPISKVFFWRFRKLAKSCFLFLISSDNKQRFLELCRIYSQSGALHQLILINLKKERKRLN